MSKNIEIKLNQAGIRELLKSEKTAGYIEKVADAIAPKDHNYEVSTIQTPSRSVAKIACGDYETYRHNLKSNDLLKALYRGAK